MGGREQQHGGRRRRQLRLALAIVAVSLVGLISCGVAGAVILGVNVHPEEPATALAGAYDPTVYDHVLDEMQSAGVQMVRVFVPWVYLEPNRAGQYDAAYLSTMDRYVAAVRAHGMQLLMVLVATPCWATSDPDPGCVNGNYAGDGTGSGYPPADDAQAGDVAAFIANRWQPQALEVWNEPNSPEYFTPPPGEDAAAAYTAMDKAIYTAVKATAPSTLVVAGAIAEGDTTFLQELYSNGIGAYSDAISIHPYDVDFGQPFEYWGDPSTPFTADPEDSFTQAIPAIHQVMVQNGDATKPLWLTEFGSAACDPSPAPCLDEQTQAQYLEDSLTAIANWSYVRVALIHEAWDYLPDENLWNGFGLLRNDFSRRPAYCVVAQATGAEPECQSDPLAPERAAQDDLTRAWTLARSYYLAHGDSFSDFDASALTAADARFSGYALGAQDAAPSPAADPRQIGISVTSGGSGITLCNVGPSRAYCVAEQTGSDPQVEHGEAPYGVFEAEAAMQNASSTGWTAASSASTVTVTASPAPLTADGTSTAMVTATVRDPSGNLVPGDQLVFSSSDPGQQLGPTVDHHDGTYSAALTSSDSVGTATITASDESADPAVAGQLSLTQDAPQPPAGTVTSTQTSPSPAPTHSTPSVTLAQLRVQRAGRGSGRVRGTRISCPGACAASYPLNAAVTLSATASAGSRFTGWSGACHGTLTCRLTMTAAARVTASFTRVPGFSGHRAQLTLLGPPTITAHGLSISVHLHNANRFSVRVLSATVELLGHAIGVDTRRHLLRAGASWQLSIPLGASDRAWLRHTRTARLAIRVSALDPRGGAGASVITATLSPGRR